MEKLTKKQSELLQQLQSDNNIVATDAVNMLREHGGDFAIIPLMEKYFNNNSEDLKKCIEQLFSDLKSSNVANIISENILKYENEEQLSKFIEKLWSSSLSFTNLLPFVELLFNKNIMIAIESSTLIEENIHLLSTENKAQCLSVINYKLEKIKDEFHKNIVLSIEELLK